MKSEITPSVQTALLKDHNARLTLRVLSAALKYCAADEDVRKVRRSWRNLRRSHDGEMICVLWNRITVEQLAICEVCTDFDFGAHSKSLQTRAAAKSSLVRLARKLTGGDK